MTQEEDNSVVVIDGEVLGNTQYVAYVIQKNTGADIFRIEPVTPYPTDHDTLVDLAAQEQDDNARPAIKDSIENPEQYDTVFVGYPNWWGIAAWPVDGFIAANDFTGKTVIPFCTSSSSGLGESGELLEKAAGTGEWLEGIRFRSGVSEETVTEWVDSLGLK